MENKIIEYAICGNWSSNSNLLHKCKVEVISKLLFTSFAKKLQEDSENTFSYLFHNHDVTSLEKNSSNHISKVYKSPNLKYCQKKSTCVNTQLFS